MKVHKFIIWIFAKANILNEPAVFQVDMLLKNWEKYEFINVVQQFIDFFGHGFIAINRDYSRIIVYPIAKISASKDSVKMLREYIELTQDKLQEDGKEG
jgi:hypothetical protein